MTDVLLVAPDLNERRMILAELVEAGYRVLAVEGVGDGREHLLIHRTRL